MRTRSRTTKEARRGVRGAGRTRWQLSDHPRTNVRPHGLVAIFVDIDDAGPEPAASHLTGSGVVIQLAASPFRSFRVSA